MVIRSKKGNNNRGTPGIARWDNTRGLDKFRSTRVLKCKRKFVRSQENELFFLPLCFIREKPCFYSFTPFWIVGYQTRMKPTLGFLMRAQRLVFLF